MVIIYGINRITETVCSQYNNNEIIYATTSGGEEYNNKTSISLEALSLLDYAKIDRLIICSMYVSVIVDSLSSINFPLEKVYAYNCNTCGIENVQTSSVTPNSENTLLAIFDLKTNLASYDVVLFFYLAEWERIKRNLKYIQYVIAPEISVSNFTAMNGHHSAQDSRWRMEHIFQGLANSVESTICCTFLSFREQVANILDTAQNVFPAQYSIEHPPSQYTYSDLERIGFPLEHLFSACSQAKTMVNNALDSVTQGKKIVAVTLREYKAQPQRNSNLEELEKFLANLDQDLYFPVLVRDTYTAGSTLEGNLAGYYCYDPASIDSALRVALYQKAFVNISVNTGPSYLMYFINGCRSLEFRWVDESVFTMTKELMAATGFTLDQQPRMKLPGMQTVVWREDTHVAMSNAFSDFLSSYEQVNET
jgi:hypothetical protein